MLLAIFEVIASCVAIATPTPRFLPFTLGIVHADDAIDVKSFVGNLNDEPTLPNYQQMMTSTTPRLPSNDFLSNFIHFHINPVRTNSMGLSSILKQLFCDKNSQGTNAVLFLVDSDADVKHDSVLLANLMTTIGNFAGLPALAWSNSPVIEIEQMAKVDFPTLLLAPSVRSQAKAIYMFLKDVVPGIKATILISLHSTGYELFANEMQRLAAMDLKGKQTLKYQFSERIHHLSSRFIELIHLGNSSEGDVRENLIYFRDHTDIRAFVLYCHAELVDVVMKEAHLLGMTTSEFLWITGRPGYVEPPNTPENYPPGMLAVTYTTSIDVQKLALRAAVQIWMESVRRLVLAVNASEDLVPPISCTRFTPPKWKYGQQFHRILNRRLTKLLYYDQNSFWFNKMTEIQFVGFDITRSWQLLGKWNRRDGVLITNNDWLRRYGRGNKKSAHSSDFIKIVTLDEPPYVVYSFPLENGGCPKLAAKCVVPLETKIGKHEGKYDQHSSSDESMAEYRNGSLACCHGFVVDLITKLSEDVGFRYEMFEVSDRKWGTIEKHTGQWNGLIQALLNGSADIVGTSLKINTERASAIDFTVPFYQTGVTILVKVQEGIVSSVAFLEPFSLATWLVVFLGCVNAMGIFIYFFENLNHNVNASNKRAMFFTRKNYDWATLFEAFWLVISMLFNATMKSETARSMSARFIVIIWAFFCVIFMSSFMANLAAFMITKEEYHDFSGIADFRLRNPYSKNPPWKFGTIPFGATEHIIRTNFPDMHSYMRPYMRSTVDDGVLSVIEEELDAFIYDASVLSFKAGRDKECRLKTVGKWYAPTGYGFGMPKSSKWLQTFNKQLLMYRASGYLQHLEDFWLSSSCKQHFQDHKPKSTQLSAVHLSSLFIMLAIALCCCSVFLLIDKYHSRKIKTEVQRDVANVLLSPIKKATQKKIDKNAIFLEKSTRV